MTYLIRYNLNKNTGVFYDGKKRVIRKFFINLKKKFKLNLIKNEFRGYKWYLNRLKKSKKLKYSIISNNLNYIQVPLIRGKKYMFWDNFIFNKNEIQIVINHYKKVWPNKKKVPFHGDLTLENIIFLNNSNIFLVDWENFREKEEWGLDLSYFLISLIVLPNLNKNNKIIDVKEMQQFKIIWKNTFLNKNYDYLIDPLEYLKKRQIHKRNFFF